MFESEEVLLGNSDIDAKKKNEQRNIVNINQFIVRKMLM